MASFLKIFGATEDVVAKTLPILYPPSAGIVGIVDGLVKKAEASVPQDGQGPIKLSRVNMGFDDYLNLLQGALAKHGEKIVYDKDKLNKAASAHVAAYNADMELQDSIKIEKI